MAQSELFGDGPGEAIEGWIYEAEFLSRAEEQELLAIVERLALEEMRYKNHVARRRGISFGGQYDFDANRLRPSEALPPALWPLRAKVADWLGVAPEAFTHVLVAQYRPGTPLGWHRDVPDFERVVGVSLLSPALMQFRRYPPPAPGRASEAPRAKLCIEPRSIYLMQGPARWQWQHRVLPTDALRYSITLRTSRATDERGQRWTTGTEGRR
jgi:alkylated DNA repair dioxygenase AlkB